MIARIIGAVLLHDLLAVIVYDVIAVFAGWPTVTHAIVNSHMAWPFGISAAVIVAGIVLAHFTPLRKVLASLKPVKPISHHASRHEENWHPPVEPKGA